MAPARPRWLATTTVVASEAGEVTCAALATGAGATVAMATPAGTRREEDTQIVLGEPMEVGVATEEEE